MHIIILYTLIDYTSWLWQAVVLFWVLWIWLNMARQRKHAKVTGSPKMTGSTCDSSPSFAFASQRGQHPGSKSNMIKSSTRMKRGELGELQNSCPMVRLPLHSCGSFIKGFLDGIDGFVGLSSLVESVIFGHQRFHRFRILKSEVCKKAFCPCNFCIRLAFFLSRLLTAAVVPHSCSGCNRLQYQQHPATTPNFKSKFTRHDADLWSSTADMPMSRVGPAQGFLRIGRLHLCGSLWIS